MILFRENEDNGKIDDPDIGVYRLDFKDTSIMKIVEKENIWKI
jgi:hypothetical protein